MIVLDIETSGLDSARCGIWQIGALELENPENVFFQEGRIDDDDAVEQGALSVIGKTEAELRDVTKQSQKELLYAFFMWAKKISGRNCICQNPQFDVAFLFTKVRRLGMFEEIGTIIPQRSFDMHSIAAYKYYLVHKRFPAYAGRSTMNLSSVLTFCGMVDNRAAHNALEDARLTAECFNRIVFGKNLFNDFKIFSIPFYLMPANEEEKHDNV